MTGQMAGRSMADSEDYVPADCVANVCLRSCRPLESRDPPRADHPGQACGGGRVRALDHETDRTSERSTFSSEFITHITKSRGLRVISSVYSLKYPL
jgi:hypothetical protein